MRGLFIVDYRIAVGGCRSYHDYDTFLKYIDLCLSKIAKNNKIIILSGHCSGVDSMAEQYAAEKGYELEIFPAQWNKYGKFAGPKRNNEMVKKSDYVIAFWDNKSKGTKNLIENAKQLNKPLRIKII